LPLETGRSRSQGRAAASKITGGALQQLPSMTKKM
jgi:hypothetical protein